MSKIALEMLSGISSRIQLISDRYDASEREPNSALPARFPNLLDNGATGIAGRRQIFLHTTFGEFIGCCQIQ